MDKKLIFEKNKEGYCSSYIEKEFSSPIKEVISEKFLRQEKIGIPNVSEMEVVRHYTNLSRLNFSVDTNFYPLGSCTMKYNPKINEDLAADSYFTQTHPYQPVKFVQGNLELIYNLEQLLCVLTGMKRFSFAPSAGAHGELTAMMMIKAYHRRHKDKKRVKVIVPDSSHGTNPASAAACRYEVIVIKSNSEGLLDIDQINKAAGSDVAAIMLTNPNTLGLFEKDILKVREIAEKYGILMYYDGANFNALLGVTTPEIMGFDAVHLNLHKTFSTPHGSGGPGCGPVGVSERLVEFLPLPLVDKKENSFYLNYKLKHSIGKVKQFYGNFSVLVKAYAYLLRLGKEGLKRAAQTAVLNANYIREELKDNYEVSSPQRCMHEVVFSARRQKEKGASALDIAKRMIDYGLHPPTIYFPLIVKEALMIEPTETESKETLDYFIEVMKKIDKEVDSSLDIVKNAPHNTPVGRLDEVKAARNPDLRWKKENGA